MMRQEFEGLSYPDRHALLAAEGARLPVYVLTVAPEEVGIAPRSGIVGEPTDSGRVLCHYEGWVNGTMQYDPLDVRTLWEAGVMHAAGRAFVAYPTIARRLLHPTKLHQVGTVGTERNSLVVTDEAAVTAWLAIATPSSR